MPQHDERAFAVASQYQRDPAAFTTEDSCTVVDMPFSRELSAMNLRALSVFVLSTVQCSVVFASDTQETLSERVRAVTDATSPDAAAEASRALLNPASRAELRELLGQSNSGVALYAGWEQLRRTLPNEHQPVPIAIDPIEAARFAGLLEGRLMTALPRAWEQSLLHGEASDRESCSFPIPRPSTKQVGSDLHTIDNMQVRASDSVVRVLLNSHQWNIENDLLSAARRSGPIDAFSAVSDGTHCYVSLHSMSAAPFRLYCFDGPSSRIAWTAHVWGEGGRVRTAGVRVNAVWLVIAHDELCVFGATGLSLYVEGFARKNGDNLFRFSTAY
jgi:hypothetical protein